jgi:hypothetical protein
LDVPGKQFFDAVDGMLGDAVNDVTEIELRIKPI